MRELREQQQITTKARELAWTLRRKVESLKCNKARDHLISLSRMVEAQSASVSNEQPDASALPEFDNWSKNFSKFAITVLEEEDPLGYPK